MVIYTYSVVDVVWDDRGDPAGGVVWGESLMPVSSRLKSRSSARRGLFRVAFSQFW